jgi:nucleoside-diphosphate-sugar epimerase
MRKTLLENIVAAAPQGDEYSGNTVLVTGASGQIGLNVVGLALARGATVTGLYNHNFTDFTHPRLTWQRADLRTPGAFPSPPADILIHTAPIWLLPDNLHRFVSGGLRRIVAFSSTSIFAKEHSTNSAEQDLIRILTASEERTWRIVAEMKLTLTILRPTMIYGMGLDANLTRMARMIRKFGFLPIYGSGKGRRQPVQARDLAEAALAVWKNPRTFGTAYNLGGGEILTYRAMIERIFRHLGKRPRIVRLPLLPQLLDFLGALRPSVHVNGEIARRMNSDQTCDNKLAFQDFGYRPREFLEDEPII